MNTFKVRNNNSKKIQKNTNNSNSNTSANSPVILGKKTRRKPTTSVRQPVNRTNLRISQLLIKRQGLKRELNITNAAIRVLKARK
jgi:hypothetical protein